MEIMRKKPETVKQMSNENYLNKEPAFNASEVKESSSTPKMVKDKVKKDIKAEEVLTAKSVVISLRRKRLSRNTW